MNLKTENKLDDIDKIYFTGFSLGGGVASLACAEFMSRLYVKNDSIGPEVRSLAIGSSGVSDKNLSLKLRDYCVSFWSEKDPCSRMFIRLSHFASISLKSIEKVPKPFAMV